MRVIKISTHDTANGPGMRVVVWTSGCEHHCPECHNPNTWDCNIGIELSEWIIQKILHELESPFIQGITFSGGDPLHYVNREGVEEIAKRVKECFPNKDIWCYTGYSFEDICDLKILSYIDILVDGKYNKDERDITLPYCGSRNQRVIRVKDSLESGRVILYDKEEF